jgi:hypothetical protein
MMSAVALETCSGDNVMYILQNKKLGASSWSQKIDLHHDARAEKHKKKIQLQLLNIILL